LKERCKGHTLPRAFAAIQRLPEQLLESFLEEGHQSRYHDDQRDYDQPKVKRDMEPRAGSLKRRQRACAQRRSQDRVGKG
jgi:hypothetical protein